MTYETIARLGRGGMGVVDLARDEQGNRVALKRLTLHGSASEIHRARQRLLREADVLRRLHHPNIVRLIDVIDEGDEIVLVMPYLSAGSLAERVAQHGPAPADEVERQARRLFGALASAHQAGIVHRDIKPANILFDERGEPCLADFGVAQTWDQTHGLTVAGMVVGTPGFMAPEQAAGQAITPASDVFSLGATLLFAATGEGPFGPGDPNLLMVRAASGKVEKVPRHLPASLRRLLKATLNPRPQRRPAAAALVGRSPGVGPVPWSGHWPGGRSGGGGSWRPWVIAGGAMAAVVAVAGVYAFDRDGASDNGDTVLEEAAPLTTTTAGLGGNTGTAPSECQPLPFQPCGQDQPAEGTDGEQCLPDRADADGVADTGCEEPDALEGEPFVIPGGEVRATLDPSGDVDIYPVVFNSAGGLEALCDGTWEVSLEAPDTADLLLRLVDMGVMIDEVATPADSAAGVNLSTVCDGSTGPPAGTGTTALTTLELQVLAADGTGTTDPYVLRVDRVA